MTRYFLHLKTDDDRAKACRLVRAAPAGSRVEVKAAKRSLSQNSRLWAMLSEVALQKEHHGKRYTPETWKILFMSALGKEMEFVPALVGDNYIPLGLSSSDLSKAEMSELIEFIQAYCAENGITLHDGDAPPVHSQAEYLATP